jgi:aspartyl-tRNA(Asn)/glutamyl-tRNA(Gln) amidotransferase subunit A
MDGFPMIRTIAEAAALLKAGELSPVELTNSCLNRIDRLDFTLRAFVRVLAPQALKAAREAEAEIAAGNYRGPLHGIPIGLKDIIDVAGVPTTAHSHLLLDNIAGSDATVTRRLRDAGAVILGKLATHEFAMGGPSFDLPWPPARNPWNTMHFTGGSSSGSGAAIAAGLCLGALGTDTGGSIRLPAAFCGIAGLKPTYGRVSRAGVIPLSYSLDHVGPMTWTVEDNLLMLQVLAGADPADPASVDAPVPDYTTALAPDLRGLRVGIVTSLMTEAATQTEVVNAVTAAASRLGALGAIVDEAKLPSLRDFGDCGLVIMLGEAAALHGKDLRERPEKYGEILRDRLMLGALLTAADYVEATRMRRELVARFNQLMTRFDVLVTASAPMTAPRLTGVPKFMLFEAPPITMPFNVVGAPALSICCGFGVNGLPIGLQIVGRPFEEATVYRVAHAYEAATGSRSQRPSELGLVA